MWRSWGLLMKSRRSPQIRLWTSHSGDTSGIPCDVTFFSSSGGQAWSVTTTSNFPVGMSAGEKRELLAQSAEQMWFSSFQEVDLVPGLSLSGWKCRTHEAPPMVISWAQSSTGFSNTRRTRRVLNGLERGCLRGEGGTKAFWFLIMQPNNEVFEFVFKQAKSKDEQCKARLLTTPRWHHPAPRRPAAGSSCSSAACSLCSSLAPKYERHRARRWPNTAGTSWYGSVGLRWAGSGKLPYTEHAEENR